MEGVGGRLRYHGETVVPPPCRTRKEGRGNGGDGAQHSDRPRVGRRVRLPGLRSLARHEPGLPRRGGPSGARPRLRLGRLGPGFAWIGSTPALLSFAVATVLEIAGYYIPWVDNLLDTVATPAAVVAGIVVTASAMTTDVSP